jgi:hypothetical protein
MRLTTRLKFVPFFVQRFAQADIHDVANDILTALFDKIESGGTPEKVSENDYLMKCAPQRCFPTAGWLVGLIGSAAHQAQCV